MCQVAGKTSIFWIPFYNDETASFYQDMLGTSIGKHSKTEAFFVFSSWCGQSGVGRWDCSQVKKRCF